MLKKLALATATAALLASCASVGELPEERRLVALQSDEPDYEVFKKRQSRDEQTARSVGVGPDGYQYALTMFSKGWTPLNDPKLEAAVLSRYADLLPELQGDVPQGPIKFSSGDKSLDAQALNTGMIIFQSGVTKIPRYYDEVNFVIAHEMSHVLMDHYRSDELKNRISTGLAATMITQGRNPGDQQAYIPITENGRIDKLQLAVIGVAAVTNLVYERRRRAQEIEADQLALELMLNSDLYNSPQGAMNYIDLMIESTEQGLKDANKAYERDFELYTAECGERKNIGSLLLGDALAAVKGELEERSPECEAFHTGVLPSKKDINFLETSLKRVTERRELVEQYYDEKLRDVPDTPPMTPILDDRDRPISFAASISPDGEVVRVAEAEEVEALVDRNQCNAAQRLAARYVRGDNDGFAPLRYQYFRADRACDTENAARHILISGRQTKASLIQLVEAFEYYKFRSDWENALEAAQLQEGVNPQPETLLPSLILANFKLGNEEAVETRLAECRTIEDRKLRNSLIAACEAAAVEPPKEETKVQVDETDGASYENRKQLVASLSFNVVQTALGRPEFRDLLPDGQDYTFYIPTDAALSRFTGTDADDLLRPENAELLKRIIRSHIVLPEVEEVSLAEKRFNRNPRGGVPFRIEDYAPIELSIDANDAAAIPLSLPSTDGQAFLTDEVIALSN
ncbi:M48 family metalloprotease [Parvularcula sp. ZS-1/3]|uniref:M48 family metalloprotease n=1 Tax=Parvularcula mediterranea TaxID=2732508 RepID=A0A7Y3W3X0_9PROT|nr:M48 family metalloprotease [Parvularcula mediterranea]NNU14904.1 M48 family metalloprotease [Parvularcula mediterranea]